MLGPFFSKKKVSDEIHLNMLQNNLIQKFDILGYRISTWFMQYSAPPRYETILQDWVHKNFETWIGQRGTVASSRSPNRNTMEFLILASQ